MQLLFDKIEKVEGAMAKDEQRKLRDKLMNNLVAKATARAEPNKEGTRKLKIKIQQEKPQFFNELLTAIGKVAMQVSEAAQLMKDFGEVASRPSNQRSDKKRKGEANADSRDYQRPRLDEDESSQHRSSTTSCRYCGNSHGGECMRKNLTWANKPWAESTKGKFYASTGFKSCPRVEKPWERNGDRRQHENVRRGGQHTRDGEERLFSFIENNNTVGFTIPLQDGAEEPLHRVLLDTGATTRNYVSCLRVRE